MFSSYGEYYYSVNNMDAIVNKRLEMVRYANEFGYKPASKHYSTDRKTIKKWCHRYLLEGISGLRDKSKKPLNSPNKIPDSIKNKIRACTVEATKKKKYITVNNVRKKTKIKIYSDATINRYIKKALNGIKKNIAKPKTNGGSTKFKESLKPFEIIQVDIKYLTDIDNLKPYFSDDASKSLMRYQITARDVLTGFPLVGYAPEKAVIYTTLFLEEVLTPFLKQFKYLDFKTIRIQTDNGSEFTNKYINTGGQEAKESSFTIFVNNHFKIHKTNIPGHCTANSEVESFHWSIERDCLAWDDIIDNSSLIKYVTDYINIYVHTIIEKRGYSPYNKIKETLHTRKVKIPKPLLLSIKDKQ